jgi:uridine phosphorylase
MAGYPGTRGSIGFDALTYTPGDWWGTVSFRDEGTTSHYHPIEFPAVADFEVVNACAQVRKT